MECELLISEKEQHPRDSGALSHPGDVFDVVVCGDLSQHEMAIVVLLKLLIWQELR
jgi:hypothetical protein